MANPSSPLIIAQGPLDLEQRILCELRRRLAERRAPLTPLPILVVTATSALRRRLSRRVVEEFGAILGLQFLTLQQLAARVLGLDEEIRRPSELFETEARRALGREPAVVDVLSEFDDGLGAALSALGDLLSAGLEPDVVEDLEALAKSPLAKGVIRAAGLTLQAVREERIALPSETMRRAADRLRSDSPDLLRAEAILFAGIDDAPGRTRAFVKEVLRHPEARLVLDMPPPTGAFPKERSDALPLGFARRLGFAVTETEAPARARPSTVHAFDAVGRRHEVVEVARRIEELCERGVVPEDILVTMRDMEAYGPDIQEEFLDRGIPFSGGRLPAAFDPRHWRRLAILELAERGGKAPLVRVLPCIGQSLEDNRLGDLDLACRHLGLSRLDDLADLDLNAVLGPRKAYVLPWRPHVGRQEKDSDEVDEPEENPDGFEPARRHLPRSILEEASQAARTLREVVTAWPEVAQTEEHARRLEQLGEPDPQSSAVLETLTREVSRHDASPYSLTKDEFLRLVTSRWTKDLEAKLGGEGGGVQVMTAAQARGLGCAHAFVLGLEKGCLPQAGSDDPVLPDTERRPLRGPLPDLGLADQRIEEEYHLFASLLVAAPDVTLSWRRVDEDGGPVSPSPFVRALITEGLDVLRCPGDAAGRMRRDATLGRSLDPRNAAMVHGLTGSLDHLTRLLEIEDEARHQFWKLPPSFAPSQVMAKGWTDVLRYLVASFDVHPWMGWIGPVQAGDPREADLYVTHLEHYATCPWSHLLLGILRVTPSPDAMSALPAVDPLLLGNAVHGAMERLGRSAGANAEVSLEDLDPGQAAPLPTPSSDEVAAAVLESSRAAAADAGLVLPGIIQALQLRALPPVKILLDLLHRDPPLTGWLGVETTGTVDPDGRTIGPLHFRADGVGTRGAALVLDDYKTGAPFTKAKRESTRRRHLLDGLRRGRHLQALAYVQAAAALGVDAEGRYLFGKDDGKEYERILSFRHDDTEAIDLFESAVRTLRAARAQGVFFARVEDKKGESPPACKVCECRMACFRDETRERARLVGLARRLEATPPDNVDSPVRRLHRDVWFLGEKGSAP